MKLKNSIRMHSFVASSRVNGPGSRAVIWFQGCTLNCPGCYNPETHPANEDRFSTIPGLVEKVGECAQYLHIEGVTLSGGEPFQQKEALFKLLAALRAAHPALSIVLFTGYTSQEVIDQCSVAELRILLTCCDVMIAGRYNQQARVASGLTASANKVFHFYSDRYTARDFEPIPQSEVTIGPDGQITITGINPVKFAA